MELDELRVVGIYESEDAARAAADAARTAGAPPDEIHVNEPLDRVASVQGEMRAQMDRTVAGPGNIGPFTNQAQRGMTLGIAGVSAIGLVLALPFALIEFGGWSFPTRLWIVALIGALFGTVAGYLIGSGFGTQRLEEPLAAEWGVPVSAPASKAVTEAMAQPHLIRLDLVDLDGQPVRTLASEPPQPVTREIGKHIAQEDRDS
jgi:hypothetical protein